MMVAARRHLFACVALAMIGLVSPAAASLAAPPTTPARSAPGPTAPDPALPRPSPPTSDGMALASGPIELARVVDVAAKQLGIQITYDADLLKSKVTLRLPAALSNDDLWSLVNRLLAEQGLTTARLGPS